ncbi:sensor histidine kinase [Terriglobus sp. ADX1]|uniref:sensor histidine kinase n=1 Tax=Terriglobus sp. ADX1 TaxID=2794063 RepID=UPI002FE52BB1
MTGDPQAEDLRARELILENDARLQLQLDGAHVGLFEWDVVTNRSRWSTGFYLLHGLEPNEMASYELWRGQVHPDDIAKVDAEIRRVVEEGEHLDVDYRIVHPTGELRWTRLQAQMARDPEGRPLAMRGYCGDVTRRKLADAALLESEKLAIAGRMSAALAHEINNPLEAAYNLLYLARGLASPGEQADLLDQTIEQLQRVSEISQQTLKFARASKPRLVNVVEVIESTFRLIGPKLTMNAVEVKTDFQASPQLLCSPGELQQILTNILNNAAEASRQPRMVAVRVREHCGGETSDSCAVRITISDTGPGMTPETLRRIREPFYTTKNDSGTGLGMWVVQELVSKLNGKISIKSTIHERWHGTAISLLLPMNADIMG